MRPRTPVQVCRALADVVRQWHDHALTEEDAIDMARSVLYDGADKFVQPAESIRILEPAPARQPKAKRGGKE